MFTLGNDQLEYEAVVRIDTYIGIEEFARPKALLLNILQ